MYNNTTTNTLFTHATVSDKNSSKHVREMKNVKKETVKDYLS